MNALKSEQLEQSAASTFPVESGAVLNRLRTGISDLIKAMPSKVQSTRDLQKLLGLNVKLCWQMLKLTTPMPTPVRGWRIQWPPASARNLYALNLTGSATATLTASTTATDRIVLATSRLSITSGATLDLANNAMIVHGGNLSAITALVRSGCNGGLWNGTGIISTCAATDSTQLTAVGVISNNDFGSALHSSFDSQPAGLGDVLLKETYYGDANLDGKVDGTDYSRIDAAYLTPATGWFNGDFNYDGSVDGSDYTLIDNAFNTQGVNLAASIAPLASPAAKIQSPAAALKSRPPFSKVQVGEPAAGGKTKSQSQVFAPGIFGTATPAAFAESTGQSVETVLQKKDLLDGLSV